MHDENDHVLDHNCDKILPPDASTSSISSSLPLVLGQQVDPSSNKVKDNVLFVDGSNNRPGDIMDKNETKKDTEHTTTTSQDHRQVNSGASRHERKPRRRKRHGARNQHRHKHFVKWLVQTFPQQLCYPNNSSHVLDIAGGKGETSARLAFCHLQAVVMIDPRLCHLEECLQSQVIPRLPKKWQQQCQAQQNVNANFLSNIIDERFRQIVTTFDEVTLATCRHVKDAVANASLLIGLHADGATEAIVDAALLYKKPFVVVPCCVFPSLFPQRTLVQADGITTVPVRSYEQFCQYLLQKDSRFVMETLPFEGRNIAIWWDGEDSTRTMS